MEELIHRFLLAAFEHLLQQAEGDLGDKQLVVVAIMTVHLRSLTSNLTNAVFVGAVQVLQLRVQLVALERQLVSDALGVLNLAILSKCLSVEHVDLLVKLVNAGMRRVLLMLKVLTKRDLLLQVVLQLFHHMGAAIAVRLEGAQL